MLIERVSAVLDRRLERDLDRPVAVALSGGGDSVALLHLTTEWARRRGRRVLALTVDHGLDPDSVSWTHWAGEAARRAGADWRSSVWPGPKPETGVSARARAARHALIADAAREAGASVVLMAHTADDRAEAAWMRTKGSTVGDPREWAPSPAWPEGRGLMLLRPLLVEARAALRSWLAERGEDWIDDPANTAPHALRAEARRELDGFQPDPPVDEARPEPDFGMIDGMITAPAATPWLGALVTCVSGQTAPPRSDRLATLSGRLASGRPMRATLGGAALVSDGTRLIFAREPGRTPLPILNLDETVQVWDGRYEVSTREPGLRIEAAAGRRAGLSAEDRDRLNALPAFARATHPVLFRGDDPRPVLADEAVTMRDLVPERLRLATGGVRREFDLSPGGMAPDAVSSYL